MGKGFFLMKGLKIFYIVLDLNVIQQREKRQKWHQCILSGKTPCLIDCNSGDKTYSDGANNK